MCRVLLSVLLLSLFSLQPASAQVSVEDPSQVAKRLATDENLTPSLAPRPVVIEQPSSVDPALQQIQVKVATVEISGSTVLTALERGRLESALEGRATTVGDIYALAEEVTKLYRDKGFILSRAYVPPQTLEPTGAHVKIAVIEGFVDVVVWPSEVTVYRDVFVEYGQKIASERPINIKTLERYMLLANSLPGLRFASTLQPSAMTPGAATLVMSMESQKFEGSASIDNRGTEARGPLQSTQTITLNNVLGLHERLRLTAAEAFDTKELRFIEGTFDVLLHPEGLRGFVTASYSEGEPGTPALSALMFSTRSVAWEAGLSFPAVLERDRSLLLKGLLFSTDSLADALDTPFTRDHIRGVRLSAEYENVDEWGGANSIGVILSKGFADFGASEPGDPNASRGSGRANAAKFELSLSRLQSFGDDFSVLAAGAFQYAADPLLAPDECSYGGATFGRAMAPSTLTGDNCAFLSVEARYDVEPEKIGLGAALSALQIYGYADYGAVYRLAPATGTPAFESGATAGAGLRTRWGANVFADVELGTIVAGPGEGDWRTTFSLSVRN